MRGRITAASAALGLACCTFGSLDGLDTASSASDAGVERADTSVVDSAPAPVGIGHV